MPRNTHFAPAEPTQRRAWASPRVRRLATSEAAFNPTGAGPDAEGFS